MVARLATEPALPLDLHSDVLAAQQLTAKIACRRTQRLSGTTIDLMTLVGRFPEIVLSSTVRPNVKS
jgi:hypothetical protein